MLGQPFGKVFPNEATAFHPSLPQRSRLASRVSALGLGRTQAAERRSTAHADRWCRMELVHALDIRTACRSRLQPQGRWGRSNAKLSRGQSCMSLSSYSECNGHDLVLPDLPQLPAADSVREDSVKVTLGKVSCKSRGGPSWLKVVGPWFQCVQQATVGQPDHTGVQWSRPRPQLGHGTQLRLW